MSNIKSNVPAKYNSAEPKPKKVEKTVYSYKSKPSIIISEEFLKKVEYICSKISTIEWSGVLLYKIEGTMDDVKNLIIYPIDILLMDIGSSAHTSFDYDPVVISEAYLENPEWIDNEYRRGLIHSHVNMGVFFSGEDMSELQDNAKFYDFYLSLIVNNKSQMTAKIAFEGEIEKKSKIISKYINSERVIKSLENEEIINEVVLFTADCDITFPTIQSISIQSIDKRIEEIQKSKVTTSYTKSFSSRSNGFMSNYGREIQDEYTDFLGYSKNDSFSQKPVSNHSKKTSEMMSKFIDAKSYLSSIFTEVKPTGTYKTFAKHIEDMAVELITIRSKIEREGKTFYIAKYLGNLFEDIFTGNDDYSYEVNVFKAYKEKINKKADWNLNSTRTEFIEFLVDVVDMLKEEALNAIYSATQIEILENLIDYFEDFIVSDRRLDSIKLKTI